MAPTTLRNVRVDDDLWSAAQTRAETEGTTVSDVIRAALEAYTRSDFHTCMTRKRNNRKESAW